jgi:hypothetical protein
VDAFLGVKCSPLPDVLDTGAYAGANNSPVSRFTSRQVQMGLLLMRLRGEAGNVGSVRPHSHAGWWQPAKQPDVDFGLAFRVEF